MKLIIKIEYVIKNIFMKMKSLRDHKKVPKTSEYGRSHEVRIIKKYKFIV